MVSLYRHFDASGRLLYVGISLCAVYRLSQHRLKSGWYCDIARVDIERHKSLAHARYAEAMAIRDEKPLHNKARPAPIDPDAPVEEAPIYPESTLRRGLLAQLSGSKDGHRTIIYTVLPATRNAQAALDRIAGGIDAPGFAIADLGNKAEGFSRVVRSAQHAGTRILTDHPDAFDGVRDLLLQREVTIETVQSL
jgi:hypothetical protein